MLFVWLFANMILHLSVMERTSRPLFIMLRRLKYSLAWLASLRYKMSMSVTVQPNTTKIKANTKRNKIFVMTKRRSYST